MDGFIDITQRVPADLDSIRTVSIVSIYLLSLSFQLPSTSLPRQGRSPPDRLRLVDSVWWSKRKTNHTALDPNKAVWPHFSPFPHHLNNHNTATQY